MSALPPAMEGTIMRTGFVGYVSATHADVPTIALAIAMQITAIRFMIAYYACMATLAGTYRFWHQHKEWL
jgi:hypothetical protein